MYKILITIVTIACKLICLGGITLESNKNYIDKFFKQLSKTGKYVPVKSRKVFGYTVTNPGTDPFYNYIRSILKVTSKFEQIETLLPEVSGFYTNVNSTALKNLENERENYKQCKKNSSTVKSKYCSKLITYCTSLENFIKALDYDKKNDLIDSLDAVQDGIRGILYNMPRNGIEAEAFNLINDKQRIKRNVFEMFLEKLFEFKSLLGEVDKESYERSLKNSGGRILSLDFAIKKLDEISMKYENKQFKDVKKEFTNNFGENGEGLFECLSILSKKIASNLFLLKNIKKLVSEYVDINKRLLDIKREYMYQRIILQSELDNVLSSFSFSVGDGNELQNALNGSCKKLDDKLKKLDVIVSLQDDPMFLEMVGVVSGL